MPSKFSSVPFLYLYGGWEGLGGHRIEPGPQHLWSEEVSQLEQQESQECNILTL